MARSKLTISFIFDSNDDISIDFDPDLFDDCAYFYFKKDMSEIFESKDISSLITNSIDTIELQYYIDRIIEEKDDDLEEAGITADSIKNGDNVEETLETLGKAFGSINKFCTQLKKFRKEVEKKSSDINSIIEVVLSEHTYEWGEFAAEDFYENMVGDILREGGSDETVLNKLKSRYAYGSNYEGLLEAIKDEKMSLCFYHLTHIMKLNMNTKEISEENMIDI